MRLCQFLYNCVIRLTRKRTTLVNFLLLSVPILLIFLITSIHYVYYLPMIPWTAFRWEDEDFKLLSANKTEADSNKEIIILRWTQYFHSYAFYKSPLIFRVGDKCANPDGVAQQMTFNCRITYDRRYLERSNALLFHLWDIPNGLGIREEFPPHHPPDQIWIYRNQESPDLEDIGYRSYLNHFNWTMTYRRDSDYYYPYGFIVPVSPEDKRKYDPNFLRQLSSNKTKLAAWIVASCDSVAKREVLVEQLRQYVPVDIFGKCGPHSCRSKQGPGCYTEVAEEYKFYLSFENALCVDYITEKFFHALRNNIVPVVYGGSGYAEIAPPGSYINARDFKSPKELANYLKYLDKNLEEYLKYFQWKQKYKVAEKEDEGTWCRLCQKVHQQLLGHPKNNSDSKKDGRKKWYPDLQDWWNSQHIFGEKVPACEKPTI